MLVPVIPILHLQKPKQEEALTASQLLLLPSLLCTCSWFVLLPWGAINAALLGRLSFHAAHAASRTAMPQGGRFGYHLKRRAGCFLLDF